MSPLIGQIALFPFDWPIEGWLRCDGRLLPVSQYQILYALLGNRFGGNGMHNFALPKLPPVKGENGGLLYYCIAAEGDFPARI
jgi:microcystin-dependent protein